MTDGQEPTGKPAPKRPRVRRARRKTSLTQSVPQGYVVMHEVNAAMCLAGGILAPRFEESAARDHHVAAGRLQIERTPPSAQALSAAQGDLSYGNVVVFEIPFPINGVAVPASLPLWRVARLAFESSEALDLFRARMSGYGDVPEDILPLEVDARLFYARGLKFEIRDAAPTTSWYDANVAMTFRGADRCAGSLLAALSALEGSSGSARLLEALGGATPGKPGGSPVEQFTLAFALVADRSPEAAIFAPVFAAVASVLSSGTMDAGFSAKALLREAEPASFREIDGGTTHEEAIQKFWTFTKDVIELRREVPEGAWVDEGGSVIARGTLLFMLNPESEQFQAVRERTPNLGTAVYFIAGLLVGLRSGLTRLGRESKALRAPFLVSAAFAHDWLQGHGSSLVLERAWDSEDGSLHYTLAYEGGAVARAKEPANPLQLEMASALRAVGVETRFAPRTGDLCGGLTSDEIDASFGVFEATVPTFPRQPALEAWALVSPAKLTLRAATTLVAEVNIGVREHCVYARVAKQPDGRIALRLWAYVMTSSAGAALADAIATLTTKARELASATSPKVRSRATNGRGAARKRTEPSE